MWIILPSPFPPDKLSHMGFNPPFAFTIDITVGLPVFRIQTDAESQVLHITSHVLLKIDYRELDSD